MYEEDVLYHYTSISALNGILTSRNVWASDCRFLNDQKELINAIDIFINKFDGNAKKALSCAFDWYNFSRAHCVFSLSRSPQVLSQWRAYGDDGRGTAVGFFRKSLSGYGEKNVRLLVDCIYNDHENCLENLIHRRDEDIQTLIKMYIEADGALNTFWSLIDKNPLPLVNLYGEFLKIKNPVFKEEQEVRLVISVQMSQVRTRVANGLIIPYVECDFVDEDERHLWCVIPQIWFGPRCDKRNNQALPVFGQLGWSVNGLHHFDCGYI